MAKTPILKCDYCGMPVDNSFSEWILWDKDLTTFKIAHKGKCLDAIEKQLGQHVSSWELDWINYPDKYQDDIFTNIKNPYEAIISLLLDLISTAKQDNMNSLRTLVWHMVESIAYPSRKK